MVLVPFVGSGSECVVAKQLGASYIGFEINPDYIKIAEEFIKSSEKIDYKAKIKKPLKRK